MSEPNLDSRTHALGCQIDAICEFIGKPSSTFTAEEMAYLLSRLKKTEMICALRFAGVLETMTDDGRAAS